MQEDIIDGITEEMAAEKLGLSRERLKKKRLAGEVDRRKYTFAHGYYYRKDISADDLEGKRYKSRRG